MSQPYVPGPVHVFVVLGGPRTVFYFGLTRRGVDIDINARYGDYMIDAGGETPVDKYYAGETATVVTDFVRWDYTTYDVVASRTSTNAQLHPGSAFPGDIGTLMTYEEQHLELLLVFPYSLKAAFTSQPKGYRFLACVPDREGLPERGAKPSSLRITWTCWSKFTFDATTANQYGPGLLQLYDNDVTAASLSLID